MPGDGAKPAKPLDDRPRPGVPGKPIPKPKPKPSK
jgi:hypothetical protein